VHARGGLAAETGHSGTGPMALRMPSDSCAPAHTSASSPAENRRPAVAFECRVPVTALPAPEHHPAAPWRFSRYGALPCPVSRGLSSWRRGFWEGEIPSPVPPVGMSPSVHGPEIACENRTLRIGAASGIFIRWACGRKTTSYAVSSVRPDAAPQVSFIGCTCSPQGHYDDPGYSEVRVSISFSVHTVNYVV